MVGIIILMFPVVLNSEKKTAMLTPAGEYPVFNFNHKGTIDTLSPALESFKFGWSAKWRIEYEATKLTPTAGPCSVLAIAHGVASRISSSSKECSVFVWSDASGLPGAVLSKAKINISSDAAYQVKLNWYNLPSPVYVAGPFWIGNYEWDTLYPTSSVDSILTVSGTSKFKMKDSVNWDEDQADYYQFAVVKYLESGAQISVSPASLTLEIDSSAVKSSKKPPKTIIPKLTEDDDKYWEDIVPGEMIIGYKNTIDVTKASLQEMGIAEKSITLKKRELGSNFILVKIPEGIDAGKAFIKSMKAKPYVQSIEPNRIVRPFFTPNDPQWSNQWDKRSIKCPEAWEYGLGSDAISLAIVDNGVQYDLPDLAPRYGSPVGIDIMYNDNDPKPDTPGTEYHGTHCSGIAAATINNSTGIAGMVNCRLYAVRVMEAGGGYLPDLGDGIKWCKDNGVNVISLSMGGTVYSSYVETQCLAAWNAGCLLIAASGNNGTEPVAYPARYEGVQPVGEINSSDQLDALSNYGDDMMFVGPGINILSYFPDGSMGYLSGTSMACPGVAGGAALVWSANPSLTNIEVRDILVNTATDLGASGWDKYYGYGKPNLQAAVQQALNGGAPSDTGMITVYNGSGATGDLSVTNITYKADWIKSVNPKVFTVTPGNSRGVTIIVGAYLNTGYYYDTLQILSNDADNSPYLVPITLRVGDVGIEEACRNSFDVNVSPNPTIKSPYINFSVPALQSGTPVVIKLYNSAGMEVKTILNEIKRAGNYNSIIDTKGLSSGIYFVSFKAGNTNLFRKLTLLK